MEYNLLDRIMDEDYYGPGGAEFLLRGMSPEGQKKFIKDLSKSLSRKLVPGAGKETRADFMTLPEEKRNYYENAKPGDVLWLKSPEFEEGLNQYYVIKGDPHYEARGSKLYKVHNDSPLTSDKNKRGRFKKVLKPIDLNELAPDFVPTEKFDIEFPQHDSKKVLEALERRNKRRR